MFRGRFGTAVFSDGLDDGWGHTAPSLGQFLYGVMDSCIVVLLCFALFSFPAHFIYVERHGVVS